MVREAAAADFDGRSDFVFVKTRPAVSGLRRRDFGGRHERVEPIHEVVERLDSAIPPDLPISLVKIDVEGGELGVLRGAARTLRRWRPLVVFEHGQGAREAYETTAQDIWQVLALENGMRIFDFDGNGPYSFVEFALETRGRRWNFVAIPAT